MAEYILSATSVHADFLISMRLSCREVGEKSEMDYSGAFLVSLTMICYGVWVKRVTTCVVMSVSAHEGPLYTCTSCMSTSTEHDLPAMLEAVFIR